MKKIFSLILITFLVTILTSCQYKIVKVHPAHDINIKLVNSLGEEWILTPDMKGDGKDKRIKLNLEYTYTGKEIKFWVDSYQFIGCDNPSGDKWMTPYGTFSFYYSSMHIAIDGTETENKSHNGGLSVKEKGLYYLNIHNDRSGLNHWNYTSIVLIINIV